MCSPAPWLRGMFSLERPNMAVNDTRTTPRVFGQLGASREYRRFQMENTWDIDWSVTRDKIISWVAHVARNARGGKLRHVVLSCHAAPGYLQLGQGFDIASVGLFSGWFGLVDNIWLPDCYIADTPSGYAFCSAMAVQAHCRLIAPTSPQCDPVTTFPVDMMTPFEGRVLVFGPDGALIATRTYPEAKKDSAGQCVPRTE